MANKIITEDDFFRCSGGMMPSPFQSKQLIVKKAASAKYITKMDISTISWVDFGCKKVMLLYAVVAAVAALVAALCVATGGAALIAICAIAGAAGAAFGAIVGTLICGQLVAPTRRWLGSKSNFQIFGIDTITGDHYMECDAFVMLGMSPEFITFAPNIKSWGQAIALGAADFIGKIFEGMMAGALIGTAGAALSGLAGAGASGGMSGVGRAVLQFAKSMPKNFVGNIVESFSGFGLGMRGVMAGQNVLATYGETGEMSAETFDKAVSDGFWSMETGSVESVKNVFSGNGTWQDYGGIVLMFAPVGEGKKELEDSLSGKTDELTGKVDEADVSGKADEAEGQAKDGEEITARRQADAETAPKEGKGEAFENGGIADHQSYFDGQSAETKGTLRGQMDGSQCAVASLDMVLRDFGYEIPSYEISGSLGWIPDEGAYIRDIPNALKELGIDSNAEFSNTRSVSEIETALNNGDSVIASVNDGKGFHAVVVDRVENGNVVIRDPLPVGQGSVYSVPADVFGEANQGSVVINK